MNEIRYICIHGHFYQPIRTNPWTNYIELQQEAYPYHDWNEKINAECYRANAGSHILNNEKKIIDIVNNYENISFNFGPSLLNWIKENDSYTYEKILEADIKSQQKFGGHGGAIAQIYNHVIMPLSTDMTRQVQVYWAIKDFEFHFKRKPEGIWLAETAVDYKTLEILAENEILFTILSPNQAKRVKNIKDGSSKWLDVTGGKVNTRMPYLCRLPSGKQIYIFFYDNDISNRISFGRLLEDGNILAKTLIEAPSFNNLFTQTFYSEQYPIDQLKIATQDIIDNIIYTNSDNANNSNSDSYIYINSESDSNNNNINSNSNIDSKNDSNSKIDNNIKTASSLPEIITIATDGETFGHHHKFGDMALAFALKKLSSAKNVKLTVFGEYLENFKPIFEVEIIENSSWSCAHGVSRWKDDCGCSTGSPQHCNFNQKWRKPLRQAIDFLSNKAEICFCQQIEKINSEFNKLKSQLNGTDLKRLLELTKLDKINFNSPLEAAKSYIELIKKTENHIFELDKIKNITNRKIANNYIILYINKDVNKYFNNTLNNNAFDNNLTIDILKTFEMYRNSLLMQSSDGWFFDDISGIESIQNMRFALRTIELIKDLTGNDYEKDFISILSNAKSNIENYGSGSDIYNNFVKTSSFNLEKICAHFAFEAISLLENISSIKTKHTINQTVNIINKNFLNNKIFPKFLKFFNYAVKLNNYQSFTYDDFKIVVGSADIICLNTLESNSFIFYSYIFENSLQPMPATVVKNIDNDINDINGLNNLNDLNKYKKRTKSQLDKLQNKEYKLLLQKIKKIIRNKINIPDAPAQIYKSLNESLNNQNKDIYTADNLLKDSKLEFASSLILEKTKKIKPVLEKLFEYYGIISEQFENESLHKYFLDGIFDATEEFIGETIIYYILKKEGLNSENIKIIKKVLGKIKNIDFINIEAFDNLSTKIINNLIYKLKAEISLIEKSISLLNSNNNNNNFNSSNSSNINRNINIKINGNSNNINSSSKIEKTNKTSIKDFYENSENYVLLLIEFIKICKDAKITPNLWLSQNIIFELYKEVLSLNSKINQESQLNEIQNLVFQISEKLKKYFLNLADLLNLKLL